MHNENSITLIKKPICLVSSSLLIMYIIFTCDSSAGTNRSNRFSFKCRLHFLIKAAWYKPEMTKFHFIFSRKWRFFKHVAKQRQVLFNILAGTGVFRCCKSQTKWSILCWTSGRCFLLKYWTASFREWGPPNCSKVRWQQEGWEGRPDWKFWEKIWDPWRQQELCLGFCYIILWQGSSLLVLRDMEKNLPALSH